MRIEIDTKHDTKEDLAHLANMLKALAGSQSVSAVTDSRLDRKLLRKGMRQDVFSSHTSSDSSSSGGLFSLFSEDTPAQQAAASSNDIFGSAAPSQSEPSQSGAGDLFSMFNSPSSQQASPTPANSQTVAALLRGESIDDEDRPRSSAKDLLDDDRIVPY